jgi:hypothetical protein
MGIHADFAAKRADGFCQLLPESAFGVILRKSVQNRTNLVREGLGLRIGAFVDVPRELGRPIVKFLKRKAIS